MQGPYVKKLIARRIATLVIPKGGSITDALDFLMDKDKILATTRKATQEIEASIKLVKQSSDNPYGDDDEAIAKALLDGLEKRAKKQPCQ